MLFIDSRHHSGVAIVGRQRQRRLQPPMKPNWRNGLAPIHSKPCKRVSHIPAMQSAWQRRQLERFQLITGLQVNLFLGF